jgi:hypothetical protein
MLLLLNKKSVILINFDRSYANADTYIEINTYFLNKLHTDILFYMDIISYYTQ